MDYRYYEQLNTRNASDDIEYYYTLYMAMLHMDADGDDEGHSGTMYTLPYGLCKNEGIDTTGMTPTDAWNALKDKTGVGHDEALKTLAEKGKAQQKVISIAQKSVKKYTEKLTKYGSTEPVDPETGEVNEFGEALTDPTYEARVKYMQNDLKLYKKWLNEQEEKSNWSEEEWRSNIIESHSWWPLTHEQYLQDIKHAKEMANSHKERIKKLETELPPMEEALKKSKEYLEDKKNLTKAIASLESAKHMVVHFSEESKEKGAAAKTAYKAGKAKEWEDKLETQVAWMEHLNAKTYPSLWKDQTVTAAQYDELKGSIQGKKDYYNHVIDDPNSPDYKVDSAKKKLSELEDFEKNGKEYSRCSKKLAKMMDTASKWGAKSNILLDKRAAETPWRTADEANDLLFSNSVEAWSKATKEEKKAVFDYTGSYHKFNEPLRGIEYGTSKSVGVDNVDFNHITGYKEGSVKKEIIDMTKIISYSTNAEDIWLRRGVSTAGAAGFLGVDNHWLDNASDAELKALVGTMPTELGFCSCGITEYSGFDKYVDLHIFAPKGTNMIYAEPFAQFGNNNTNGTWDGEKKPTYLSNEAEAILQQGTQFRVTKAEINKKGILKIDLIVVGQNPRDLTKE